jgi:preprotein translocase subunit SecF
MKYIVNPKIWIRVSVATIVVCAALIIFIRPLWGIDFTGGSLLEISAGPSAIPAVQAAFTKTLHLPTTIQTTQSNSLIVRTAQLTQDQYQAIVTELKAEKIINADPLQFESIGPTIGKELQQKSWMAVSLVLLLMIAYLAYTFRGAKALMKPWKFGVAAIYALLHDLLVVTAVFVLLGKFKGVELDTLFVTAQLAIFGYSVHDTIIIFDRLKTEWIMTRSRDFAQTLDRAVRLTMMRSINTSLTILIVLVALLFFGGSSIHWFVVALTVGTIAGTYSSIFVASPLLYYLSKRG